MGCHYCAEKITYKANNHFALREVDNWYIFLKVEFSLYSYATNAHSHFVLTLTFLLHVPSIIPERKCFLTSLGTYLKERENEILSKSDGNLMKFSSSILYSH